MERPRSAPSQRPASAGEPGWRSAPVPASPPATAGDQARPAATRTAGPAGQDVDTSAGKELALAMTYQPALIASQMTVQRSLVGRARGHSLRLRQGVAGMALARDLSLRQGAGWLLAGLKLRAEMAATQWLVGGVVQARQVLAVAVIAGRVEGQVRCLFDARGAFAFGAGVALVSTCLRLVVRRR
jgi:hypothetical protein